MKIVNTNKNIIEQLRKSGLSQQMKSLESCDFLVIEEKEGKIAGAGGIGGLFHVPSLQIDSKFQGQGIGKILFDAMIKEAKKRNYSFLAGSRNPENTRVIKIEDKIGFFPVFRIHYSQQMTRDVVITLLNPKGRIVEKFLRIFNNIIGISLLAVILKILKPLFKLVLTYPPEEFPDPSILHIIKNFEKI